MELREYDKSDAKIILTWINNEREFRLWSANRYKDYPITPDDMNDNYDECKKYSNFYPITMIDNDKVVGHLIIRNISKDNTIMRLGFIIVDRNIRGKGYGKKLIELAITYAKTKLQAKEINLGVFTCNESALYCYESVGFEIVGIKKETFKFYDENWDYAELELRK